MRTFRSPKGILIVELANNTTINFTNDEPIRWIMVSTKVKESGFTETHRDLIEPGRLKSGLKRSIKKQMKPKELDTISKIIKKYVKKSQLTQKDVDQIENELK